MNAPRILFTGATGAFGRHVAGELYARGCELVLVVRGGDASEACRRGHAALGSAGPHVRVVRGDVGVPGLGLSVPDALLAASADIVVHSAASTEFGLPLHAARAANVKGTENVLAFAERLPELRKLVHVSTAFVAGKRIGRVLETQLGHDAGFVTTYEQSKHEAEALVRTYADTLPVTILRPSVVTQPWSGVCTSALWFALRLIGRGLVPVLPGAPTNRLDVVPIDDAAAAAADLILADRACGTFHIASGDAAPPVADVVRVGAGRAVRFVDVVGFRSELGRLRRRHPDAAHYYDGLATFVELLSYPKIFDTSRTDATIGRRACEGNPLEALVALTETRSVAQ